MEENLQDTPTVRNTHLTAGDLIPMVVSKFGQTAEWKSVVKRLSARKYKSPAGYADHERTMRDLAAFLVMTAYCANDHIHQGVAIHPADGNFYASVCEFAAFDSPQYWINEDLAQSLIHTDLPDDLSLKDLEIPLGAFMVHFPVSILPSGFLVISYGEYKTHQFPGQVPQVAGLPFHMAGRYPELSFIKKDGAHMAVRVGLFINGVVYGTRWNDSQPLSAMTPPQLEGGDEELFRRVVAMSVNLLVWMNTHHKTQDKNGASPPTSPAENAVTPGAIIGRPVKNQPFYWSPTWLGANFKANTERSEPTGRHMPTHWRRGHMRGVWSGPRVNRGTGERTKGTKLTVKWFKPVRIH